MVYYIVPKWRKGGDRISKAFIYIGENTDIPIIENHDVLFSASVAEIGNDDGEFEELVADGVLALAESLQRV